MKNQINLALQVIPKSHQKNTYEIVDKAIEVIQQSGLRYQVCPCETVIEGTYEETMKVVKKATDRCFEEGAEELLVNIKMQIRNNSDVTIEEKTGKY